METATETQVVTEAVTDIVTGDGLGDVDRSSGPGVRPGAVRYPVAAA